MSLSGARRVPSPAEVEAELASFRQEVGEGVVLRACSLNLVVVCDCGADRQRVTEMIAAISRDMPSRALLVGRRAAGEPHRLDVFVSTHCHRTPSGVQVCSEQVTIEAPHDDRELVPATVLQLLVEEMPVVIWWRPELTGGDPWLETLPALADCWLVDSARSLNGVEQLQQLELLRAHPRWHGQILDAAWVKLDRWRESMASFFDGRSMRPALERVSEIEVVATHELSAAYFAGWLASRLEIGADDGGWARADGTPVRIALETVEGSSESGILSVKLVAELRGESLLAHAMLDEQGLLQLRLSTDRLRLRKLQLRLPALDEAGWVCGMLQRRGRDPVYEASAAIARRLLSR